MNLRLVFPYFLLILPNLALGLGNQTIPSFEQAKKIAVKIHMSNPETLYCACKYSGKTVDLRSCGYQVQKDPKRASRLEWEHVVAAENFGRSFKEWREGAPECVKNGRKFKGRKCAKLNPEFARIEADLYNLWPEIGELNGLRSNFQFAELGQEKEGSSRFGQCKVKIEGRKFEPMPHAKGRVARTYLYMDQAYPGRGIISKKSQKLFESWDKLHPVDEWECTRGRRIENEQGNKNPILDSRCSGKQ
jgi:deoxyribonuclease-1